MSPAQLIIDTRERVYQHIKDSLDGLTEMGVIDALKGDTCECWSCGGSGEVSSRVPMSKPGQPSLADVACAFSVPCHHCLATGQKPSDPLAPWLVHACLGYLLAEARIIDTSDDATEYRWVAIHV